MCIRDRHNIEAVVDRIVIKEGIEGRLTESIEASLKMAEGLVIVNVVGEGDHLFSENFACPDCDISIGEIAPRMFSFNAPFGKCDYCDGLGTLMEIDEKLVIPNDNLSIMEGAVASWGAGRLKEDSWTYAILQALNREYGLDLNTPIKDLTKEQKDLLLYGTNGKKIKVDYVKDGVKSTYNYAYEGEINGLQRRYRETNSDLIKGEIEQYMSCLLYTSDPYTVFFNAEEFDKLMKESQGSLDGIGVQVGSIENKIVIIAPIKDSPSDKAGLLLSLIHI